MGLAIRQSRKITVDRRAYRWTISRTRQASKGQVDVVIELTEPGQRLIVSIPCRNFFLDFSDIAESRQSADMEECKRLSNMDAYRPITPRIVAQIIKAAQEAGWKPEVKGKPFRFQYANIASE